MRIVNTASEDRRPAVDVLWNEDAYRRVHAEAALAMIDALKPLALPEEPQGGVSGVKHASSSVARVTDGEP